jgi:hypothetical protein
LGERSLRRALIEYVEHYHVERNRQGKGNILLFPRDTEIRREPQPVQCRGRLVRSCAITSRGGVIAHPRFKARNSDFAILRAAIEIEEVAAAALLSVVPTLALRQDRSPVKYRPLRRSNILAIRDSRNEVKVSRRSGARNWKPPRLPLLFQLVSASESALRMAWTAIAAMTPVRKSPETPIPIASARASACRGTMSP